MKQYLYFTDIQIKVEKVIISFYSHDFLVLSNLSRFQAKKQRTRTITSNTKTMISKQTNKNEQQQYEK